MFGGAGGDMAEEMSKLYLYFKAAAAICIGGQSVWCCGREEASWVAEGDVTAAVVAHVMDSYLDIADTHPQTHTLVVYLC